MSLMYNESLFNEEIRCARSYEKLRKKIIERKKRGDPHVYYSKTGIREATGSNGNTVSKCLDYYVARLNKSANDGTRFPALKLFDRLDETKATGLYVDPRPGINSLFVKPLDHLRQTSLLSGLPDLPFVEELRNAYYSFSVRIASALILEQE